MAPNFYQQALLFQDASGPHNGVCVDIGWALGCPPLFPANPLLLTKPMMNKTMFIHQNKAII